MSEHSLKPCGAAKHNRFRHGHASHGPSCSKATPTYQSWLAMRARCNLNGRDNSDRYKNKGITICDRWSLFDNFLADMGERPVGKTLDRYPDISGNYEPTNCRWATPREQARNTRRNKLNLQTATEVALKRLRGQSCQSLAIEYGISESLPREIVKGRTWPDALIAARDLLGGKND